MSVEPTSGGMDAESGIGRVIERLQALGCRPTASGAQWSARCPAHSSTKANLRVREDGGKVLIYCHGRCDFADVVAALGLTAQDLMPRPETTRGGKRTVGDCYRYVDEHGNLLYEVVRLVPKAFRQRRPDGAGGWIWDLNGTERVLYRLPEVCAAVSSGHLIWITEGEKDADALQAALPPGEVATTAPGGAGKWLPQFNEPLRDAGVMIWADRDDRGRRHAEVVAAALSAPDRRVRIVESRYCKDAAEHLAAGYDLGHDLVEVSLCAVPPQVGLEPEDGSDTWSPKDLAITLTQLASGERETLRPSIGRIEGAGDVGLLVPGKLNGFHGGTTSGKTMTATAIACQELEHGNCVWFVDFEDDDAAIVTRFLELGATEGQIRNLLRYRQPRECLDDDRFTQLMAELRQDRPTLVIVDSTGEWMGLQDIEDIDRRVAQFMQRCAKPLASTGAAVLLIDHVPHSDSDRLAPLGSVRKINAVDGAQYLVKTVKPMARGRVGRSQLIVAKDRTGYRAQRDVAAVVVIDSTGQHIAASFVEGLQQGSDATPSGRISDRRILGILSAASGSLTVAEITDRTERELAYEGLATRTVQNALRTMENDGLVVRDSGKGNQGDRWSVSAQGESA